MTRDKAFQVEKFFAKAGYKADLQIKIDSVIAKDQILNDEEKIFILTKSLIFLCKTSPNSTLKKFGDSLEHQLNVIQNYLQEARG